MNLFFDHAAVVNADPAALKKEVELVRKKYGPWFRIRGFESFKQFFFAMHLSKRRPFSMAFLRDTDSLVGEAIIKKVNPQIQTIKYSDTQQLSVMLGKR